MIVLLPQPPDLEAQIDKAWTEVLNARTNEAYHKAYNRFATLIGWRRQPKKVLDKGNVDGK